jgi:plasmid replication initiation protein
MKARKLENITGFVSLQGELLPKDETENNYTVSKSNALIEAQYDLTAQEQKLLNSAIAKINPMGEYPDGIPEIRMTGREISQLTGIPQSNVYRFLRSAAERYHSIPIVKTVEVSGTSELKFEVINIAHKSKWDPETGMFSIKFHADIESELINLAQYTKYSLVRLKKLGSKYAIRLYELAQKNLRPNSTAPTDKKYTIDEIRFYLSLDKHLASGKKKNSRYEYVSDLRRRVLDVAIAQINKHTDVYIEYEPYTAPARTKIIGFKFRFRYLTAKQKHTDETADVVKSLTEYYEADKIDFILATYSQMDIISNLDYFKERTAAGFKVKNPAAFVMYLLKFNVAALPETANPFSGLYDRASPEAEFVRLQIMPNWFNIPEETRIEIQKKGLYADSIRRAAAAFKDAYLKTNSIKKHTFSSSAPIGSEQWEREFTQWCSADENMDWADGIFDAE